MMTTPLGDDWLPMFAAANEVDRWQLETGLSLPWWLVAGVIMCVTGITFLLYRLERLNQIQRVTLTGLRAAALLLLLWMLWGWQVANFRLELPELWIVVDASQSMSAAAESAGPSRWDAAITQLIEPELQEGLQERYRRRYFLIGERVREVEDLRQLQATTPEDKSSRLGEQLASLLSSQGEQPAAAVWLLSDGRITAGQSFTALADGETSLPVFTTVVGTTDRPNEIRLAAVQAPTQAIPGDAIEVVVTAEVSGSQRQVVEVRLEDQQGTVLDRRDTLWDGKEPRVQLTLQTQLPESGSQKLRVVATPLPRETATDDNARDVEIRVRDEPLRVLLIAGAPNYEFRFLKHLLERSRGPQADRPWLQFTSVLQGGDPRYADQDRSAARLPPMEADLLDQLDVVILIDADPEGLGRLWMERVAERVDRNGLGLLVVAGNLHLPSGLRNTPLENILPISGGVSETDPVRYGAWSLRPTPFGDVERALKLPDRDWQALPPVQFFVSRTETTPIAQVLLEAVPTTGGRAEAALVSQRVGQGTVQVQLTDELFRLVSTGADDRAHEWYWLQTLRRLAQGRHAASKDFAQVTAEPQLASADEPVEIAVTLGETWLEQAAGRVEVELKSDDPQVTPQRIVLSPQADEPNRYLARVGPLNNGSWTAMLVQPTIESQPLATFQVLSPPEELVRLDADREAMRQLSQQTGAREIEVKEATSSVLSKLPRTEPIRVEPLPAVPLWNRTWAVLILMGLLTCEWGLRRWWSLA